ncbi:MAG TPA: glycosyl hydrolase family 8 [Chitinispirillaceae bacterium]|nr:glycosyl hydrolase family 8 [Chitinispirillaceae bacterium]
MMKQKFILPAIIAVLITGAAYSQTFKYPMNIKYRYGFLPKTLTNEHFDKWYSSYKKSNLLPECNGGIRTASENASETKVESMGWAMIIAAYMGDKTTFDGLYKFYKSKIQGHGMMGWKVTCGGVSDGGSASDGDLDVAFAMVVASWQWGDSYKTEAINVIKTVKKLIVNCSGTSVIAGGMSGMGTYGGCNETDISYHTPAFFRCFAEISGDDAWNKLAEDSYILLNNGADKTTGLVPDWQSLNGGQASGGRNHSYGFDACRVPWRIALDYLWNGNEKAKEWCTKISNWAYKVGPANIKDGYSLNGNSTGRYHNMSYVGGFAVAAMCNSQDVADAFGTEVARMPFDNYWYHGFLGNCYMLAMTGNMWQLKDTKNKITGKKYHDIGNDNSLVVKHLNNHKIELSGISEANSITLSTLQGQLAKKVIVSGKQKCLLDVSSLKNGCYILTTHDKNNKIGMRQIFSIY